MGQWSRWSMLLVAMAVIWHLATVCSPPLVAPPKDSVGRDFASYYYAARVASEGGNPYSKAALEAVAISDGLREEVHPYFYPPPFLWLVSFAPAVDLVSGFQLWWFLNEGCLAACCMVLVTWWRPLGGAVGVVVAAFVALMYGVAYSAELGQANFPVLLAVLVGLALEPRWPVLGGIAVGLAAMWKMSPALLVLWWALRGRNTAVMAAVATAIGSSVATLPLLGLQEQLGFYRYVLPGLQRGDYNGLEIKIGMFANHSVPNLLHQLLPSADDQLSAVARAASTLFQFSLVGALGYLFRFPTTDPLRVGAQASTVLVAALLIPVYTYEHHLVFALPAMILSVLAVARGWLPRWWVMPLGIAVAVLLFDLPTIRRIAQACQRVPVLFFALQEAKFVALVTVGSTVAWLGAAAAVVESRPPAPRPV